MEYPKIETLFVRGEDFRVTDELKNPVIADIKTWEVTEKIDGTNIRVILSEDGKLTFNGRTDNAQLNGQLLQVLINMFDKDKLKEVFWREGKPCAVTLYGEGYGAGIQKAGSGYRKDKSFRLFDVLVDKWWLNWENVKDVAEKLQIKTVPFLGMWTLDEIVNKVKEGIRSQVAIEDVGYENIMQAEGIVGRTRESLFDKRGNRLIIKLKTCDYKGK